jgi:predicted ferric reductase
VRIRPHLGLREAGPAAIILLFAANAVLWLVARPSDEAWGPFAGQLLGAEAILLLAIGLVLISTLPWIEEWFDGIDKAAIWHRRVAIAGVALLMPHILLSSNPEGGTALGGPLGVVGIVGLAALVVWAILPRWQSVVPRPARGWVTALSDATFAQPVRRLLGGYERWRALHRTTGLFVAAGFVHGVLDGSPFDESPLLRWTYVAIGGIGLAFYVYRELLARLFVSLHDYQVQEVRQVEQGMTEIALGPIGRPMAFTPGQFAMVYLEEKDGWHRHPFTISSAPHERLIRITVKALGDYTSRMQHQVEPGMPAVIGGPHGRFDYHRGTPRQIWLAGGVGVTPFLSWLRSLDGDLPYRVEFFFTTDGDPPFADEIREIAARHDSLNVHLVNALEEGRLVPKQVLDTAGGPGDDLSVFMCGPKGMLSVFDASFRLGGVRPGRIRREHFDWR